ncbi:hypothetical protein HNY73_001106 [Argiope bruennichi]|uniref:Uncharacterized protein n=1 Tax=Argiope bruennichi TaxID=94029 RepID=A0A8T0G2P5_ARGBR|nr:hypothetical protein HNY73_001106 [Argiope bruennichi]
MSGAHERRVLRSTSRGGRVVDSPASCQSEVPEATVVLTSSLSPSEYGETRAPRTRLDSGAPSALSHWTVAVTWVSSIIKKFSRYGSCISTEELFFKRSFSPLLDTISRNSGCSTENHPERIMNPFQQDF